MDKFSTILFFNGCTSALTNLMIYIENLEALSIDYSGPPPQYDLICAKVFCNFTPHMYFDSLWFHLSCVHLSDNSIVKRTKKKKTEQKKSKLAKTELQMHFLRLTNRLQAASTINWRKSWGKSTHKYIYKPRLIFKAYLIQYIANL